MWLDIGHSHIHCHERYLIRSLLNKKWIVTNCRYFISQTISHIHPSRAERLSMQLSRLILIDVPSVILSISEILIVQSWQSVPAPFVTDLLSSPWFGNFGDKIQNGTFCSQDFNEIFIDVDDYSFQPIVHWMKSDVTKREYQICSYSNLFDGISSVYIR